ncbi:hypothetical protein ABB37_02489 [Leptomonas pyrrhocoris]|uniref:Uncharacterized protein n=1 Tax=Leptomonas pyrrhocoris TaxID=157538 RepID=A0A0N0VG26_LEPPY|nr:hypothetical protein ABB37_02489 [Leptomonas pyrrhocoris]KPA82654.1 hypothetical protein ABB37_02489 [Leptomonas pyrrhocoris]|eukprot:XP_015661093.1 hypothetical protein ABB37_02489 [Leptomonas pyrrhocoris]
MPSNSGGAAVGTSSPPPETTRVDKGDDHHTSRRGSTALWVFPRSSAEALSAHDKGVDAPQQNSGQPNDYHIPTSDSSSVFSGCETVAPQTRGISYEQPDQKASHGLLTGLLSRRGGRGEGKPRKNDSNGRKQRSSLSSQMSLTSAAKHSSSSAARNPLLKGFDGTANNTGASPVGPHVGRGSYDWPTPPSPIKNSEILHPPVSSSRHELSTSPMLSLQSHSSPNGTLVHGERRDKRSASRFPEQGESHFVPLGSTDLANRGDSSASGRRQETDEVSMDEALSSSCVNGRTVFVGRRKTHNHGGVVPGASPSTSTSQYNELLVHTRSSPVRLYGGDENDASVPSSFFHPRSMRDAKAVLLRHAQGANASVRTSHAQSLYRAPSNVGGGGAVDNAGGASHRHAKTRGASRDHRSFNCSRSGVGRDEGGSLYSMGFDDDAVRTSISPGNVESLTFTRAGVLFPATAANQEGNMTSSSTVSTSRRLSRTDDGSGAIVEVMETSALTSRGNVAGGSNNNRGSSAQSTRGRSTGSIATLSNGRHGNNASEDDTSYLPSTTTYAGSYHPKQRQMLSSGYSLSRTGGSDGYGDSEDSVEMEERHRQKVDEVLRRLNRPQRANAGPRQSATSRPAASDMGGPRNEVMSALNTSTGPLTGDIGTSGTSGDNNNNYDASGGGGVTWPCIGGLGWGSLTGFGAAAAESATDEMGTAGWPGLGGEGGSEEWYARMRKKAAEEEAAEAAAYACTASSAIADANARFLSPGTISITAGPSLAPNSNPTPGIAVTSSSATTEAPMPSVDHSPAAPHPSSRPSRRISAPRSSLTPQAKPTTSANTSLLPARPPTSARTPAKPAAPFTGSEKGVAHVLSLTEHFMRRPPGVARHPEQPQQQRNTRSSKSCKSPLDPPQMDIESFEAHAPAPSEEANDTASVSSGCQPSLPAANATTAPRTRRVSCDSAYLDAVATTNVNVDVSGGCSNDKNIDNSTGNGTGVVLPSLSPPRTEASTPLSCTNIGATTPGHRRFDYHSRTSLPRVLPISSGNTGIVGSANSTYSEASSGSPKHNIKTAERISMLSSTNNDTSGRGITRPASPTASTSQPARGTPPQASVNGTFTAASATSSAGNEVVPRKRRHMPNKRPIAPASAAVRAGSTGLVRPGLPTGPPPKRPENSASPTRVVTASTRRRIT